LLKDVEDTSYSIRGQFREGRAAYLDMSSTTPLDPRVLDAMAPHMVRMMSVVEEQRKGMGCQRFRSFCLPSIVVFLSRYGRCSLYADLRATFFFSFCNAFDGC
jgi:hypothetical protein